MGKKFDKWIVLVDKWLDKTFIVLGVVAFLLATVSLDAFGIEGFIISLGQSAVKLFVGYIAVLIVLSISANLIDIRKSVTKDNEPYDEDELSAKTAESKYYKYDNNEPMETELNALEVAEIEKEIERENQIAKEKELAKEPELKNTKDIET